MERNVGPRSHLMVALLQLSDLEFVSGRHRRKYNISATDL